MASSMKVYCQIIKEGLEAQRKKDHARMSELRAQGVSEREAMRQVLFPWKSVKEYDRLCEEYDRAFAPSS